MLREVTVSFLLFLFIMPHSVESTVKCYKGKWAPVWVLRVAWMIDVLPFWGFSGDGRPFKQRLCQTEYCIKWGPKVQIECFKRALCRTTEPSGGATYGCDDFTPYCKVSGARSNRRRRTSENKFCKKDLRNHVSGCNRFCSLFFFLKFDQVYRKLISDGRMRGNFETKRSLLL